MTIPAITFATGPHPYRHSSIKLQMTSGSNYKFLISKSGNSLYLGDITTLHFIETRKLLIFDVFMNFGFNSADVLMHFHCVIPFQTSLVNDRTGLIENFKIVNAEFTGTQICGCRQTVLMKSDSIANSITKTLQQSRHCLGQGVSATT